MYQIVNSGFFMEAIDFLFPLSNVHSPDLVFPPSPKVGHCAGRTQKTQQIIRMAKVCYSKESREQKQWGKDIHQGV